MDDSENKDSALAEVARLKKTRQFAGLARALLRVNSSEAWVGKGFKKFGEWAEHVVERKRSTVYLYVEIARYLPELSDEEMNRLGLGKCKYLMYLVKDFGRLDREWVEKAGKLNFPKFKLEVERVLPKEPAPIMGEFFDPSFRGMVHAPTNEQGVVYLFGMVSHELGFLVETVNRSYPDCTAKQLISEKPQRWRRVGIEFEYLSSNFDHPPEGSNLIVCWEDDLAKRGQKAPLPVLELRSAIEKLSPAGAGRSPVVPHIIKP
jgi:hypothetical protein